MLEKYDRCSRLAPSQRMSISSVKSMSELARKSRSLTDMRRILSDAEPSGWEVARTGPAAPRGSARRARAGFGRTPGQRAPGRPG